MKLIFWLRPFLLLVVFSSVYGEIKAVGKADSLRKVLDNSEGSDNISIQLDLALLIFVNENEEAQNLAKSALEKAKKSGNRSLEMQAYYVLGRINVEFKTRLLSKAYYDTAIIMATELEDNLNKGIFLFRKGEIEHRGGDDSEALKTFNEALLACRLSNNFRTIGSCYSMMGTIFRVNGMYDRAIENIIKSKLNYEKADFSEGNAWAAYLLGRIYADLGLSEKALEYFHESLKTYEELSYIDGNRNGIALCHEQIGLQNWKSDNFEEALKSIELVLEIHTETGSKYGISNAYKHIGKIEYSKGNYDQAENYLTKSLVIKKEIGDLLSQPTIYEYLGLTLLEKGIVDEGIKTIQKGLKLAHSNSQKKIQLDIYSKLHDVYLSMNDFQNAISCQNKQIEIQNLILSGAASAKVEQLLQTIYEIDDKNSQVIELGKQNVINDLRIKQHRTSQIIMIIGIFLATLFSVVIYLFYRRIHAKNKELNDANITKDKLFSIVAHDLKGPIGSAIGISEFFIEEVESKNLLKINKYAVLLHQSLTDTFSLLNNLLEWTLSHLQKIEFKPKWLFLNNVLEDIKVLMSSQILKKNKPWKLIRKTFLKYLQMRIC
jgi:tetratricopeptide (TPR) repeat protein